MKLTAGAVFSDNMVLQREKPVPVWGKAAPGETVCCALSGFREEARADSDGRWRLTLPPMAAGGPYTMTLESGGEALGFSGVYLGEVWLAGGQSNMELALAASAGGDAALANCANGLLHFYATPKVTTPEAAEAAQSGWRIVSPDTAANLSAVAYYAAVRLARELQVHVGILECFWGGTYAHCWMSRSVLSRFPAGQRRLRWYDQQMGDKSDQVFREECLAYEAQVDSWNRRIAARRAAQPDVTWKVLNAECGLYPWPPPAGPTGFQRPGNLYDSMLTRIRPYAIRGVWYYQGEQNALWPEDYEAELGELIRCWRDTWQDPALPFLVAQLPMFAADTGAESWPLLRAAQAAVARREPGVALAVLADLGEEDNIHPTDKEPVGTRLALLALDTVYRLPVNGRSPYLTGWRVEKGAARLTFARDGGGLYLAPGDSGFALAGADGKYYPAQARAEGCRVTVTCPQVPSPVSVRYAWHNFGPAGLYGGGGLPAEPFAPIDLLHPKT